MESPFDSTFVKNTQFCDFAFFRGTIYLGSRMICRVALVIGESNTLRGPKEKKSYPPPVIDLFKHLLRGKEEEEVTTGMEKEILFSQEEEEWWEGEGKERLTPKRKERRKRCLAEARFAKGI